MVTFPEQCRLFRIAYALAMLNYAISLSVYCLIMTSNTTFLMFSLSSMLPVLSLCGDNLVCIGHNNRKN